MRSLRRLEKAGSNCLAPRAGLQCAPPRPDWNLHPSNFARVAAGEPLYYVDDELYPPHGPVDLAEAVANRLNDPVDFSVEWWRDWGVTLGRLINRYFTADLAWSEIFGSIGDRFLADSLEANRAALLRGHGQGAGRSPTVAAMEEGANDRLRARLPNRRCTCKLARPSTR